MKITLTDKNGNQVLAVESTNSVRQFDYAKLYKDAVNALSGICKKYKAKAFVENTKQDCNLTVFVDYSSGVSLDTLYNETSKALNEHYLKKGIVFKSDDVGDMYIQGKDVNGIIYRAHVNNFEITKKQPNSQEILNLSEVKQLLSLNNKEIFSTKFSDTDKISVKYLFFKSDFEESLREGNKQFTIGQLSYTCANSGDYGNFDDFDVFVPAFKALCQKINLQKLKLVLSDYSDDETVYILASLK